MEKILKEEFRALALRTRSRLDITQKDMAEMLAMSDTSYSDIETGVYMCGTLTAVLLLLEQPEPEKYLAHLRERFEELYDEEMKP